MRSCKYTYISFTKICHTIIMLRVIQCSRVSESSTAVSSSPITPTNGTAMTESVAHVHTQDVAYVQELCSIIFNNRLAGNYQQVHGCTMGQGRDRLKYKGAFRISLLYLLSTFFFYLTQILRLFANSHIYLHSYGPKYGFRAHIHAFFPHRPPTDLHNVSRLCGHHTIMW